MADLMQRLRDADPAADHRDLLDPPRDLDPLAQIVAGRRTDGVSHTASDGMAADVVELPRGRWLAGVAAVVVLVLAVAGIALLVRDPAQVSDVVTDEEMPTPTEIGEAFLTAIAEGDLEAALDRVAPGFDLQAGGYELTSSGSQLRALRARVASDRELQPPPGCAGLIEPGGCEAALEALQAEVFLSGALETRPVAVTCRDRSVPTVACTLRYDDLLLRAVDETTAVVVRLTLALDGNVIRFEVLGQDASTKRIGDSFFSYLAEVAPDEVEEACSWDAAIDLEACIELAKRHIEDWAATR